MNPSPVPELPGRCALVTGAGRGIGLAMARGLAAAGCAVAIQDIEHEVTVREAGRIAADTGANVSALGGDATELASFQTDTTLYKYPGCQISLQ